VNDPEEASNPATSPSQKRKASPGPPHSQAKSRRTEDSSKAHEEATQGQDQTSTKGRKGAPKRKDHVPTPEEIRIGQKFVDEMLEDADLAIPVKVPNDWEPDVALYGQVGCIE
jgi:hypothetical protein